MAARRRKPTADNIREIVEEIGLLVNEDTRFERLTATRDVLSLIYGNAERYEQVLNMLSGNNRLLFEAGREVNINKRYKMVLEKLCELNELQFSVTANMFPPMEYYLLLRERCELCNDNAACMVLDSVVSGDPDADTEFSRLGLLGLWKIEDNRQAGAILVGLGKITKEEFQQATEERDAAVKPKEIMHGCAICAGLFPESKCVKAIINQSEEWVCITDFERLEAEGKAIRVKSFVPGVEVKPAQPAIAEGFEDIIRDMKAKGKEWEDILAYIDTEFGHDGELISSAAAIFYQQPLKAEKPPEDALPLDREAFWGAPPEPKAGKPPEELDSIKKEIEERMEKLKTEKKTPEESPEQETLTVKEEIIIEPDATTLMYMEPADYETWRFGDFEGIIPGLEFEDLQELSDYVGLSEKMTEHEKEDIRALISKRINEIRAEGS